MIGSVIILGDSPVLGIYSDRTLLKVSTLDKNNIAGSILSEAKSILGAYPCDAFKIIVEPEYVNTEDSSVNAFKVSTFTMEDKEINGYISFEDRGVLCDIVEILHGAREPKAKIEIYDKLKLCVDKIENETIVITKSINSNYIAAVDSNKVSGMEILDMNNPVGDAVELLQVFNNPNVDITGSSLYCPNNYLPTTLVNARDILSVSGQSPQIKNTLFLMDYSMVIPGLDLRENQPQVSVDMFKPKREVTAQSFNTPEPQQEVKQGGLFAKFKKKPRR